MKQPVAKQSFDLRKENPAGRVDVLAANLLERFAACVPELSPVMEDGREAIHMRLNELCGPHVVNLTDTVNAIGPYLPLAERIIKSQLALSQSQKGATK